MKQFKQIFSVGRLILALFVILAIAYFIVDATLFSQNKQETEMKYNPLTAEEERVILNKGTERPFTGEFYQHEATGIYTCKRCDAPLYRSEDKFDAHCGWPSFDGEIPGAVKRQRDADGFRTEILCNHCGAHLGHVFLGEGFTAKNVRHCVNSISMNFVPQEHIQKAYFAGGCFWGVEYHFKNLKGVLFTEVGYMGGHTTKPTYEQVCSDETGHAEALEVTYDSSKIDFETLAKLFFEIHDPTQVNRQGPDVGDQYRSEIFYLNDDQKQTAEKLIRILEARGYKIATKLTPAEKFWVAEDYHQEYYEKHQKQPSCHIYQKRF